METRISYPVGVVGPGLLPPFMAGSMRPGQGGVVQYGAINVGPGGRARRVGPVRSPIGEVWGYRDWNPLRGPVAHIPADLPGPIYPGYPGSWHVGPTVIREGRLRYGPYPRAYGAPGEMPKGVVAAATGASLLIAMLGGAAFGAGAGMIIGPSASQGAKIGAVASLLSVGVSLLLKGTLLPK
jgi:hypothetical protein